jgi:hypothetical protein
MLARNTLIGQDNVLTRKSSNGCGIPVEQEKVPAIRVSITDRREAHVTPHRSAWRQKHPANLFHLYTL